MASIARTFVEHRQTAPAAAIARSCGPGPRASPSSSALVGGRPPRRATPAPRDRARRARRAMPTRLAPPRRLETATRAPLGVSTANTGPRRSSIAIPSSDARATRAGRPGPRLPPLLAEPRRCSARRRCVRTAARHSLVTTTAGTSATASRPHGHARPTGLDALPRVHASELHAPIPPTWTARTPGSPAPP